MENCLEVFGWNSFSQLTIVLCLKDGVGVQENCWILCSVQAVSILLNLGFLGSGFLLFWVFSAIK